MCPIRLVRSRLPLTAEAEQPHLLVQPLQLGHHALARRLAADDTVAGLPVRLADVREAQNVECVGLHAQV